MEKHTIEHIKSIPAFMKEIHRISKPGGKVIIETPYFTSLDSWEDANSSLASFN